MERNPNGNAFTGKTSAANTLLENLSGSALTGKPQRQRLHWKTSAATPSLEQNLAEKISENNQCFGTFYTRVGASDNTLALGDSKHSFAAETGFAAENWLRGRKLTSWRKLTSGAGRRQVKNGGRKSDGGLHVRMANTV